MTARDRRFTLVEVVASLAILGAVLGALLVAVARSARSSGQAARILRATSLCASRAAALRAGTVEPGSGVCEEAPRYRWEISPAESSDDAPTDLPRYRVRVFSPDDNAATAETTVWLPPEPEEEEAP